MRELLESKEGEEEDQNRLACEIAVMLMYGCHMISVPRSYCLRSHVQQLKLER